jgi:hypothetical protein
MMYRKLHLEVRGTYNQPTLLYPTNFVVLTTISVLIILLSYMQHYNIISQAIGYGDYS